MKNKFYAINVLLLVLLHFQGNELAAKVKVACVGNSITFGHMLQTSEKYPFVLQTLLGADFEVKNFGAGGTVFLTSSGEYWGNNGRMNEVEAFQPDIIVIELGTNDSKPQYKPLRDNLVSDIEAMISTFNAYSTNPQIYVCIPIPAFKADFGILPEVILDEITPKILEATKNQNVETIDLYTLFKNNPEFAFDGIHLSAKGTNIMANCIYSVITPITKIASFSIDTSVISIPKNNSLTMPIAILPQTANVQMVLWSSTDSKIATVSPKGVVKAVSEGTCTIKAISVDGAFVDSCFVTVLAAQVVPNLKAVLQINSGGGASGSFVADKFFSGGATYKVSGAMDITYSNSAPESVYQNERYGNFTYSIAALKPNAEYIVRLHSAEIYHNNADMRLFNLKINDIEVLTDFDVFAEAGFAKNKAIVSDFSTKTDANGTISIRFITIKDQAVASGIEILEDSTLHTSTGSFTSNTVADFSIYPNPATDYVTIDFGNSSNNAKAIVQIVDLLGKEVYKSGEISQTNTLQVNTSQFGKGVYVVNITIGTEKVCKKLVGGNL